MLDAEQIRMDVVMLNDDNRFWDIASALTKTAKVNLQKMYDRPLLALDPGETTGVCMYLPYENRRELHLFQLPTKTLHAGIDTISTLLATREFGHLRYEDYRVYANKTEDHANASLHTAKLIGVIECLAYQGVTGVPTSCCLAMHAKTFWTDEKLKLCDVYVPGQKHARDAERHMLRFMCEQRDALPAY